MPESGDTKKKVKSGRKPKLSMYREINKDKSSFIQPKLNCKVAYIPPSYARKFNHLVLDPEELENTRNQTMNRFSNTLIGLLNLITLLASIPIIGAGLWMARNSTTCETFLQTPLLIIGFGVLVISLAGFVGACFHVAWALWLYLVFMLFLIGGLIIFTVFGLIVTGKGGGVEVPGRFYKEYRLENYSAWLRDRINDPKYWLTIKSCILGSKTCAKLQFWTPYDYLERNMSPVQSGCCKPPTACNYDQATVIPQDQDCYRWNNDPSILCYDCDSCKAGVLENIKVDWHKLSVLNIFMLVLLIGIYSIGCCAFRNSRRSESDHPYGQNRMTKVRPRWDFYWWRWWHDRRHQLY